MTETPDSPMSQLQELAQFVRGTIPLPQAMLQLRINERAGGITFIWEGVEFFVNSALTVLEARGDTLYLTGLSMLLQSVLVSHKLEEKNLRALADQLGEAEARLRADSFSRSAVDLIKQVRHSMEKLRGARLAMGTNTFANPGRRGLQPVSA